MNKFYMGLYLVALVFASIYFGVWMQSASAGFCFMWTGVAFGISRGESK